MSLRALSCLLVFTFAFGASKQISFDGEAVLLPVPAGMDEIGAESTYFQNKAESYRSHAGLELYAAFHGHDERGCLQIVVLSSSGLGYGPVTTPAEFQARRVTYQDHRGERYRIHRENAKRDLFAAVQCQGKVLTCMMFRHSLVDGVPDDLQTSSAEDELRFLAWVKDTVAANPPLTEPQMRAEARVTWIQGLALAAMGLLAVYLWRRRVSDSRGRTD